MKEDRAMTLLGILTALTGILACSVGKWIMGGIILLLAFGIFWNRGGGRFNDRSIYEKLVKTDLTIPEIYERVKDMDTPLGKPWIAGHKGFEGDSIVFGPSVYKDCVVVSPYKGRIDIKHITLTDNIIRGSEDEYRFRDFIDTREAEVTPQRYSVFASYKIASVMLVQHLMDYIRAFSDDRNAGAPESSDMYTFYYHNSSEGYFRDADNNDLLKVESMYSPFTARVMDTDGNEMASVSPRRLNAKGIVVDEAGYDLYADGEHFGSIERGREGGRDVFRAVTGAGTFTVRSIPACRRANVASNYVIEMDGKTKAVIGGSPNILFDTCGRCQNDIVLSYDDDYFVLYAIMEIFIMTINKKFLK